MNDTPREVELKMLEMLAERTPEERLRMASGMYDAGIALLKVGIHREHPQITDTEMRVQIFLRMYGDCYSEQEKERIVQYLRTKEML